MSLVHQSFHASPNRIPQSTEVSIDPIIWRDFSRAQYSLELILGTTGDADSEIIRPYIHTKRVKGSPERYVSVPDFKTVNLPAPVLEAIDKAHSTAKKVKNEENTRPARLGPPVRFKIKKATSVVARVPAAFHPLPNKVVSEANEFEIAPLQDVTNFIPGSWSTQRQTLGPIQTTRVEYEEDLISFSPPRMNQSADNAEEDLICFSPPRMNQNASSAEQPVFIRRALPAQFMPPAQRVEPAQRGQRGELTVEDPYLALGIYPGATRDQYAYLFS